MQNSTEILLGLRKTVRYVERGLSPLSQILVYIGAAAIGVMMLITVADVIGRRAFNSPVLGSTEISQFMMVIAVFFSIACCEYARNHITVGIVVDRLPQRTQNVIDSIMYVIFLVTTSWLSRQLLLFAFDLGRKHTVSGTLLIPLYPFALLAFIGCALLSFVVLIHLLLFISEIFKK